MFTTINRFFRQPRWHRDGQQVLRFHIESLSFLGQTDVQEIGLRKGPGDVHDGGPARFDEYFVVVVGAIWLGQLGKHLVDELIEENFSWLVKFQAK